MADNTNVCLTLRECLEKKISDDRIDPQYLKGHDEKYYEVYQRRDILIMGIHSFLYC